MTFKLSSELSSCYETIFGSTHTERYFIIHEFKLKNQLEATKMPYCTVTILKVQIGKI